MNTIFERLLQESNRITVMFLILGLPGMLSIIAGVMHLRKRKLVAFQGWSKPTIIKGNKAIFWGKLDIAIGLFFLFIFAMYLISIFL
jgi:hypothetical protein